MQLRSKSKFSIIPYQSTHQELLLNIFDQNVPIYFGANERIYFQRFLEHQAPLDSNYFTVIYTPTDTVVGSGGFYILDGSDEAHLTWGFLNPELHSTGVGSLLLKFRIEAIRKLEIAKYVVCETSQKTFMFFQKHGFVLEKVVNDYWTIGLDLYKMRLDITLVKEDSLVDIQSI